MVSVVGVLVGIFVVLVSLLGVLVGIFGVLIGVLSILVGKLGMTAFQYNHSFGFQKPMKVKVVK